MRRFGKSVRRWADFLAKSRPASPFPAKHTPTPSNPMGQKWPLALRATPGTSRTRFPSLGPPGGSPSISGGMGGIHGVVRPGSPEWAFPFAPLHGLSPVAPPWSLHGSVFSAAQGAAPLPGATVRPRSRLIPWSDAAPRSHFPQDPKRGPHSMPVGPIARDRGSLDPRFSAFRRRAGGGTRRSMTRGVITRRGVSKSRAAPGRSINHATR